jgi:tripartite-type tricarboxylate transporter receptor subunit TctC
MNHRSRLKLIAAAALLASTTLVRADWPDKPIHLVVPFPPGGTTDVVARHIVSKVGEILGSSRRRRPTATRC